MSVYVDIPQASCVSDADGSFKSIAEFETRQEAIAFCQEHFGADDQGRVQLVTGGDGEDSHEPDLPFNGSHAPDCPYRCHGECNCWRSDPDQNPELASEDDDPAKLHEGCECAHCGETINAENDGTSSPHGSMHIGCADEHEAQHPDQW